MFSCSLATFLLKKSHGKGDVATYADLTIWKKCSYISIQKWQESNLNIVVESSSDRDWHQWRLIRLSNLIEEITAHKNWGILIVGLWYYEGQLWSVKDYAVAIYVTYTQTNTCTNIERDTSGIFLLTIYLHLSYIHKSRYLYQQLYSEIQSMKWFLTRIENHFTYVTMAAFGCSFWIRQITDAFWRHFGTNWSIRYWHPE